MSSNRILKRDPNGALISGGVSKLIDTLEVAVSTSGFVAVALGSDQHCKSIIIKTRNDSAWLLSAQAAGTRYATINGDMAIDLVAAESDILFYAKGTVSTVLEVILLD
ncbi:MAG: hypothetical protein KAV87_64620 [Desulfobacteraceae bacterium]|nr:hypothetical protein [Desulfobacteraceae bacterium]